MAPARCPEGRTVLYVGSNLATSAAEVFGEAREAPVCPNFRVAMLRPTRPLRLFDLTRQGVALSIGALPSLADGPCARALTQAWARAIYEDDPAVAHVDGIAYRSAYNGGEAIAVWDSTDVVPLVETVAVTGVSQDFPLRDPNVYRRLVVAMSVRLIDVRLVDPAECRLCP